MDDESRLISEFNEAKFQIYRLHNIWVECKQLRESGQLIPWKWKLDTAQIELNEDAKRISNQTLSEEDEEGKRKNERKSKDYIQILKLLDDDIENSEKQNDLKVMYEKLKEKEMLLREVQQECGKGARFRSEDDDYSL